MESNPIAFEQIFKKYYRRLCLYARKFIDDDDVAEDVVQEVFSNLWERQIVLELDVVLRTYLFRSVHNRCLNYLNHQKLISKHHNLLNEKLKNLELEYYGSDQYNASSLFELEGKIDKAISELPPQCRNVFELSRVNGLKNREIAEQLDISIKVVEKHITKALIYLRESLKDYLLIFLLIANILKKH